MKQLCEKCKKPLVAIGLTRKNGKPHNDWNTRKLHKKCWIEIQKGLSLQIPQLKAKCKICNDESECCDMDEFGDHCVACSDTGLAYWSDGVYGACFNCSLGTHK